MGGGGNKGEKKRCGRSQGQKTKEERKKKEEERGIERLEDCFFAKQMHSILYSALS